jgi:tRNA dimethylallyltransferase
MLHKTCLIIAGPTAVGKTALAIRAAQHFSTEIISADSRQCYRELQIGVARPSTEELAAVRHHFIASHSIHDSFSAADYEQFALQKLEELFQEHDTVVVTGGTGLYLRALTDGLDPIPAIEPTIRAAIIEQYEREGLNWLQDAVAQADPLYASAGEMQNPQRLMRALEVVRGTGQSIVLFQSKQKQQRNFRIRKIYLDLPRAALYDRIDRRVETMMEAGLLEEARALYPYQQLNALQTVGYREWFAYFDETNGIDDRERMAQTVALIKQHTRHYAKRQLTWFRRETDAQWVAPDWDEVQRML